LWEERGEVAALPRWKGRPPPPPRPQLVVAAAAEAGPSVGSATEEGKPYAVLDRFPTAA